MKKLIIAAAIVCAAAISQAASVNWTDSGVQNALGTGDYSGALTLFFAEKGSSNFAVATTGAMSEGAFDITLDDEKFVGGTTYQFYYTMETATHVYTSETLKKKVPATSTALAQFDAGGEWKAVPEPTSGLLLLLGVAGLALKRKQK